MYETMLLTLVSAGKQASFTITQFKQYNLSIYGLHSFNLDVRIIFMEEIQKGVNQEKQTNSNTLCIDIIEWYSRGRHIATYLSYAMTARKDRSLQTNDDITKA